MKVDHTPDSDRPRAKPGKGIYRRNLPHLQPDDKTFYITFCTYDRWWLPGSARTIALEHCLRERDVRIHLHGVVVMPDHVHMIMVPLRDPWETTYALSEIMNSVKGASSHRINKALGRRGTVWQPESFDHVLRSDEKVAEKLDYMCLNPVRRGLVEKPEDYPWLWLEQMDGEMAGGSDARG